jgi:hypothetical protein
MVFRLWTLELSGYCCGLLRLIRATEALMAWSFIPVCIPSRRFRHVYLERTMGHLHGVILVGLWAISGPLPSRSFFFYIKRYQSIGSTLYGSTSRKEDNNLAPKQSSHKSKHILWRSDTATDSQNKQTLHPQSSAISCLADIALWTSAYSLPSSFSTSFIA